ncbi:MAG TPA: hypothetical protein VGH11_03595 [Jatrophihabitans sp.]
MAINTQQAIQALALDVLDELADEDEYLPFGGAILVDPLASDDSSDPEFARFAVSFGTRDCYRLVEVAVATDEANIGVSMTWAAHAIADAVQDEIIELVGAARPVCSGHSHPMSVRVDDNTAWWQCPTTESTRRPIWPRV